MKRILSTILAAALLMTAMGVPAQAAFPDVPDNATQQAATLLQSLGIVAGFPDGSFRPNNTLTRAEFCKMAVILSGVTNVTPYTRYTTFKDMKASHWALGYVNAAASVKKIIAGFPDGTFRPDIPITYAQAVTILMRLLGYTDADVGPNWPNSYLDTAQAVGLTSGFSYKAEAAITRAGGAQLFSRAILGQTKDGKDFLTSLGAAKETKVVLLSTSATAPSGTLTGLAADTATGFYPTRTGFSSDLAGRRGTLLVDKDGYAILFTPDTQTTRALTVKTVTASSVSGTDGGSVAGIPAAAVVYNGNEKTTYGDIWLDLQPGASIKFYFTAAGAVDYIFLNAGTASGGVTKTLTFEPTSNPLPSLGFPESAAVYKNGVPCAWQDLRRWDVVTYNQSAGTVSASNLRITGVYENGLPNRESPNKVTTLNGQTFEVLPAAVAKLGACKLGEAVTFLFTWDRKVADVYPQSELSATQVGLMTAQDTVLLPSGLSVTGKNNNALTDMGSLVTAAQRSAGQISVQPYLCEKPMALNLTTMKAGELTIAPYAVFYEKVSETSQAVRIHKEDLPASLPASSVLHVGTDSGGRVDVVVLKNVTRGAYLYGKVTYTEGKQSSGIGDDEYYNAKITVAGAFGSTTFEVTPYAYASQLVSSSVCGIAYVPGALTVLEVVTLTRTAGLTRADFSGNAGIIVSGRLLKIPDGFKVEGGGKYMTVQEARVYSNNFEVYTDRPVAEGGQIRYIIAR